jgi:zinc D-Ala-D-Ala carboxypeptidase
MRLSKNFTLSEFTRSATASRKGIDNTPSAKDIVNLQHLVSKILQPMRNALGPIRITSGYRSPALNRAIGGSTKSQHCKGQAADIQIYKGGVMNNSRMYDYVLAEGVEFDQMINEFDFSWIHISLKEEGNRKNVLEAYKDSEGDTAYTYVTSNPVL